MNALRTFCPALCGAALLVASCTDGSLDEQAQEGAVDSEPGRQVPAEKGLDALDEVVSSAELELRRGVILVAIEGQDFQAIGLTETISDLESGRFSKTIEVGRRVTSILGDERTTYVGSNDRSHWIRFDWIRWSGPTFSALPVDAFIETFDTPENHGSLTHRRAGMLSADGKQLVIETVVEQTSGRRVQIRTIHTADVGAIAVAEVSEPLMSDGKLEPPRVPRSSIPAEAIFASQVGGSRGGSIAQTPENLWYLAFASQRDGPRLDADTLFGHRLPKLLSNLLFTDAYAQTGEVVCELGPMRGLRAPWYEIICTRDGEEIHRGEIPCDLYDYDCREHTEGKLEAYAAAVEAYLPGEVSAVCARIQMNRGRPSLRGLGPNLVPSPLVVPTLAFEGALCPPPEEEEPEHRTSVVKGDPHIWTADRVSYGFQAGGEFLLYKRGTFEVQQRYEGTPGSVTWATATAVRLGDHVLEVIYPETIDAGDGGVPVRVDGQKTQLGERGVYFNNGALIAREPGGNGRTIIAVSPTGEAVRIENLPISQNVTLFLLEDAQGSGGGLAGTPNGRKGDDLATRAGDLVSTSDIRTVDGLYRRFGESWRVSEIERLFTDRPFDDLRTDEYLRIPDRYPSLALFSAEERLQGEERCRAAGVSDGPALVACAFDVLADPSQDWASQAASSSATVMVNGSDISPSQTLSQVQHTTESILTLKTLIVDGAEQPIEEGLRYDVYLLEDETKVTTSYDAQPTFRLPVGRYRVTVRYGSASVETLVEVKAGEAIAETLVLGAGSLRLTALTREGAEQPIEQGLRYDVYLLEGEANVVTSYDAQPTFRLPVGRYRVTVRYGNASVETLVEVKAGSTIEKTLVLGAGSLRLTALTSEGAEQRIEEGLRYDVYLLEDETKVVTSYDAQPTFRLPVGRYRVTVRYGSARVETLVEVKAGETIAETLVLGAGSLRLTALTRDGAQQPIEQGLRYDVYLLEGETRVVTSYDAQPTFRLPVGRYRVTVRYGSARVETTVEVKAAETTEETLVLGVLQR